MSLTLNAAEVRALAWVEEQHNGQGCAFVLTHYVDEAMCGWISVGVRFVGREERMRPSRYYVVSPTGRVWAARAHDHHRREAMLRDADYDTAL